MGMGIPGFANSAIGLSHQNVAQTDQINNQMLGDIQRTTMSQIKMQNATAQASLLGSLAMAVAKVVKKIGDNVCQLV